MTTSRRITLALPIIMAIVLVDQLTKQWALSALADGRTIALLPTLEFDLLFNRGISFGAGQGLGRVISVAVVAMSIYLAVQIWRTPITHRVVLFSVILGGALGNLVDRLVRAEDGFLSGAVIDFIDVSWFAVFNVADAFVVCGALALGVIEIFLAPRTDEEEAATRAVDEATAPCSPDDYPTMRP